MKICVLKLGGSLFDLPDLKNRLSEFLGQLTDCRPLLICGGGRSADLVRQWDSIHQLDATTAHWLAIGAMQLNERLLCQLLPDASIVSNQEAAQQAWQQNTCDRRSRKTASRYPLPGK